MSRRLLPLSVALALVAGVTGCVAAPAPTPTPSADTQSVAAACAEVSDTVADAAAALQQVDPADAAAAARAIDKIGARLRAASGTVANAQVGALLPTMRQDLTAIGEALTAIAAGDLSQTGALAAPIEGMQRSFADFRDLCSGS